MTQLAIHGLSICPYAWRTRLAAMSKGIDFEWLPFDAAAPDARCATDNPTKRSPLCKDGDFTVTESGVIAQYIDEAFSGPALQAATPKERALARLMMAELGALTIHPGQAPSPETVKKVETALEQLEGRLKALTSEQRPWLNGAAPGLVDHLVWSGLGTLRAQKVAIPTIHERVIRYADAAHRHPVYQATAPAYAV